METESKKKVRRSRTFSLEYKEAAVKRMQAGESPSALARELGVVRKVLYYWQQQVRTGRKMSVRGRPKKEVSEVVVAQGSRIAELERLVGQQQLELAFFRGALRRVAALSLVSSDTGATPSLPKFGK
jgi:transposase-like protein